jgi:hypothetical protein
MGSEFAEREPNHDGRDRQSKKRGEDIAQSGKGQDYTLRQSRCGINLANIPPHPPGGELSAREKVKAARAHSNSFQKTDPVLSQEQQIAQQLPQDKIPDGFRVQYGLKQNERGWVDIYPAEVLAGYSPEKPLPKPGYEIAGLRHGQTASAPFTTYILRHGKLMGPFEPGTALELQAGDRVLAPESQSPALNDRGYLNISLKVTDGKTASAQNKEQSGKTVQNKPHNPYEKMPYGEKLSDAMNRVPGMLKGDAKALLQQLTSDPKFAAILAGGAGAFAALQFTPVGPAINLAFTVVFGLKAGVEIGKFFYEAFQAKDEAGIKAAAESLKTAIEDGGPLLISGLAGGFKTLNGLLTKLRVGKQGVQAVRSLANLPDGAQEAIRGLALGEQEIIRVAELSQRSSSALGGILQMGFGNLLKTPGSLEKLSRMNPGEFTNFERGLRALIGRKDPILDAAISEARSLDDGVAYLNNIIKSMKNKPSIPQSFSQGDFFAEGGTSKLYRMKGHPNLLIKPGGGRLPNEAKAMVQMEMIDIPTVYVGKTVNNGQNVLVLQKIDGVGSKDIIGRLSKPIKPQNTEVVTQKTIDDLERIYSKLKENNANIGDFQFIIRKSDGSVFVNDPVSFTLGKGPSGDVRNIIDRFRKILREKNNSNQ